MKLIKIKLIPRSSKNEIVGEMEDGTIKVKLKAPPTHGEANKSLIQFLSKNWKMPKSKIEIVRGKTSRLKTIKLHG